MRVMEIPLADALQSPGPPLLLDGAMGTELLRRGVPTPLPLWSAPANVERPEVVESIHRDYVEAGCRLLSTNTFRTSWYGMNRAGRRDAWEAWNRQAVSLARRAARRRAWVLGAVTTLEDCYHPELVPPHHIAADSHARQINLLVSLGVDGILLETFNTLRELDIVFQAARRHPLPVLASVLLKSGDRLYDGTPLQALVRWALRRRPDVLLLNCAAPPVIDAGLRLLRRSLELPLGAYGNVGEPGGEMGFHFTSAYSAFDYARWASRWARMGARVIGGCCGTTPDYMRQVEFMLRRGQMT